MLPVPDDAYHWNITGRSVNAALFAGDERVGVLNVSAVPVPALDTVNCQTPLYALSPASFTA